MENSEKKIDDRLRKYLEIFKRKAVELYGKKFEYSPSDWKVVKALITYFFKIEELYDTFQLDPKKGIFLCGPIGCGKTASINILKSLLFQGKIKPYNIKSARQLVAEFEIFGSEIFNRYSAKAYNKDDNLIIPIRLCIDDFGAENNFAKFYGNERNVIKELILSRYDEFVSKKLITDFTSNLINDEVEELYGSRVRSRMREMVNLIYFDEDSKDKRK